MNTENHTRNEYRKLYAYKNRTKNVERNNSAWGDKGTV